MAKLKATHVDAESEKSVSQGQDDAGTVTDKGSRNKSCDTLEEKRLKLNIVAKPAAIGTDTNSDVAAEDGSDAGVGGAGAKHIWAGMDSDHKNFAGGNVDASPGQLPQGYAAELRHRGGTWHK